MPTSVSHRVIAFAESHTWPMVARPTGVERSRTHTDFRLIPIDGAAEWEEEGQRSA